MAYNNQRILSIDLLRGLVMVVMALDHVRDYFHFDAFYYAPTDLEQTTPALFWTRFITHYCAPVFVFLAGTSSFFVGRRLSKSQLSVWLLKRGLWLVLAEITIIKLAWTFKLDFSMLFLQVIWVLGVGMIFLAAFIHLPKKLMLVLCLSGVFLHNLLDPVNPDPGIWKDVWTLLHVQDFVNLGTVPILIAYPLIPWIFVMPLGYLFGTLYTEKYTPDIRIRRLYQWGFILCGLFLLLRLFTSFGEPFAWTGGVSPTHSVLSFFNLTKYPPSLLFLLATLGPSLIFLAWSEKLRLRFDNPLVVVGRVPMFFYIIHIYAIHFLALLAAVFTGFDASDMLIDFWINFQPELQGYGFNLWIVYIIWILLTLALFPLCKWYDSFKRSHRQYWWLTYL